MTGIPVAALAAKDRMETVRTMVAMVHTMPSGILISVGTTVEDMIPGDTTEVSIVPITH